MKITTDIPRAFPKPTQLTSQHNELETGSLAIRPIMPKPSSSEGALHSHHDWLFQGVHSRTILSTCVHQCSSILPWRSHTDHNTTPTIGKSANNADSPLWRLHIVLPAFTNFSNQHPSSLHKRHVITSTQRQRRSWEIPLTLLQPSGTS
jgi:hypothetical protein